MFRSVPDMREEFWQKVERSLGCTICAYSLAKYSISASLHNAQNAFWGLLYISKRGIHFHRFAQQSFINSLINNTASREFSFSILFEDVQLWRAPQKLPFLKSLFVSDNSSLMVRGRSVELPLLDSPTKTMHGNKTEGDVLAHYFALDMRKKDIIQALELYLQEKRIEEE